ncbi:MAG: 2OG-Fe(II) oxygenase [Pseudomonadota bacterium]|nr:2OG-Fe(II) oxygenase [Pseudomonadota bacterium]
MYLFDLKPNLTGQPTCFAPLFTEEQCKALIDSCESNLQLQGGTVEDRRVIVSIRSSAIGWLSPEGEHRWLFDKIRDCMNVVNADWFRYDLAGFEGIQFTKYSYERGRADFYSSHVDTIASEGTVRKLSFTVQLSDPDSYSGGDVVLYSSLIESASLSRAIGSITFFPSYMIHEVLPVTKGVRYSLVGWGRGPAFT